MGLLVLLIRAACRIGSFWEGPGNSKSYSKHVFDAVRSNSSRQCQADIAIKTRDSSVLINLMHERKENIKSHFLDVQSDRHTARTLERRNHIAISS